MAQFYAEIQGNRGGASRMGTKDSGIYGHIRGWNIGARVTVDCIDGRDIVRVFKTGGSNDPHGELIAVITEDETTYLGGSYGNS